MTSWVDDVIEGAIQTENQLEDLGQVACGLALYAGMLEAERDEWREKKRQATGMHIVTLLNGITKDHELWRAERRLERTRRWAVWYRAMYRQNAHLPREPGDSGEDLAEFYHSKYRQVLREMDKLREAHRRQNETIEAHFSKFAEHETKKHLCPQCEKNFTDRIRCYDCLERGLLEAQRALRT